MILASDGRQPRADAYVPPAGGGPKPWFSARWPLGHQASRIAWTGYTACDGALRDRHRSGRHASPHGSHRRRREDIEARFGTTRAKDGAEAVIDQIVRLASGVSHGLPRAEHCRRPVWHRPDRSTQRRASLLVSRPLQVSPTFRCGRRLAADCRCRSHLENDGIAAAIGEWRLGAGRGRDNLVYVTVSTASEVE